MGDEERNELLETVRDIRERMIRMEESQKSANARLNLAENAVKAIARLEVRQAVIEEKQSRTEKWTLGFGISAIGAFLGMVIQAMVLAFSNNGGGH